MNRRVFLVAATGSAAGLLGCRGEPPDPQLQYPPLDVWMDPGPLRSTFVSVDGLRMHMLISVEAAPAGAPAIVLVHGSGLSGQYMVPTARMLTPHFRVHVPDIPGYGDSGDPGRVLDIAGMADWLAAWTRAVGLTRAAWLGNSFGCQVIAELAVRYPGLVTHALLQGPTTPPDERHGYWQFVRWRQNQAYNPRMLGAVTEGDYDKAGAWRLIRSFVFQITDRIEDKAPLIEAPTLVIRGAEDPIAHQAFCEMLVRRLPRGALAIIPDVAHTLVFTAPAPLAAAARTFVLGAET